MPHFIFIFHLISLSSGIVLLSILLNDTDEKNIKTNRAFCMYFGLITLFVCASAACLYVFINVPELDAFNTYISIIFVFLGLLPISLARYQQLAFQLDYPTWYTLILKLLMVYCAVMACLAWWLNSTWDLVFLLSAICLMLFLLAAITWFAKSSGAYENRSSFAKRLSKIMVMQSLILPLGEVLLFSEHLSISGVTYSLPLVFIINNFLLWKYRQHLIPTQYQTVRQNIDLDCLSPKEQEIVKAVCKGLSNKQIAYEMNISPSTVKNHMYSIFKKCEVTNRVALVTKLQ